MKQVHGNDRDANYLLVEGHPSLLMVTLRCMLVWGIQDNGVNMCQLWMKTKSAL